MKELNKQQQRRIAKRRHNTSSEPLNAVVIAHHGQDLLVEHQDGQQVRARARRTVGRLTTGDQVSIREDGHQHWVIERIGKRKNLLLRPDAYGKDRPMAANIDQVIVLIAPTPWMNPGVVERTMISVFDLPAQPIIVLNKRDQLETLPTDERNAIEAQLEQWHTLGFEVCTISAKHNQQVDSLKARLEGKQTLLVGLSGTGKTTLTRALTPDAHAAEVRALSSFNREGVHTTRTSTRYHVPGIAGFIIDAPGVRDFPLSNPSDAAIMQAFPDIQVQAQWCRFNDCRHLNEPHCAVLAALQDQTLCSRRYALYQEIMQSRLD